MTGTCRHHNPVDMLLERLLPATRTKQHGDAVRGGSAHAGDCGRVKHERARRKTSFDDRLYLRRNAEAVHIPIGSQKAYHAPPLDDRQRPPDCSALPADPVENRVPAKARRLGLGKAVADPPQQVSRRTGRRIDKFAEGLPSAGRGARRR